MSFAKSRILPLALAFFATAGQWASAQGCVAAHSNQRSFDELITGSGADASHRGAGSTRRRETIGLPKIVVKGRPVHEQWRLGLEVVQNH